MKRALLVALLVIAFPGCKSYYEVRDLRTDRVYYTRSLERWKTGAIRFKDAGTGATVTLTTHEFKKIPQADYENMTTGTKSGR
jgi:hypothetical protein